MQPGTQAPAALESYTCVLYGYMFLAFSYCICIQVYIHLSPRACVRDLQDYGQKKKEDLSRLLFLQIPVPLLDKKEDEQAKICLRFFPSSLLSASFVLSLSEIFPRELMNDKENLVPSFLSWLASRWVGLTQREEQEDVSVSCASSFSSSSLFKHFPSFR